VLLRESEGVRPSEWLLRKARPDDYDRSLPVPFNPTVYGSNSSDADGISLFRECFVSPHAVSGHCKRAPYIVARVRARDLTELGLTLDHSSYSDPSLPGHFSVPELRHDPKRLKAQKEEVRGIRTKLVEKTKAAEVPEHPGSRPDATCGV
jgi:hypothetical protein